MTSSIRVKEKWLGKDLEGWLFHCSLCVPLLLSQFFLFSCDSFLAFPCASVYPCIQSQLVVWPSLSLFPFFDIFDCLFAFCCSNKRQFCTSPVSWCLKSNPVVCGKLTIWAHQPDILWLMMEGNVLHRWPTKMHRVGRNFGVIFFWRVQIWFKNCRRGCGYILLK